MYNLLVGRFWDGKPVELELGRVVREHTAAPLTARFGALDETSVNALKGFPALIAYEADQDIPARIGWITRIRHRNNAVMIEYEIEDALPEIPHERILSLQGDLDLTDWEMNRTHWALKDVDLFPVLIDAGVLNSELIRAQPPNSRVKTIGFNQPAIDARPTVFRMPAEQPDNGLVSVMMPFSAAFQPVYVAIEAACRAAQLRCQRADQVWENPEVMQDIFSLIYRSSIVIVDYTGQNANVFYETGIAHTLGRPVVPITQSPHDIPFDIQHHRYLHYLNNNEGRTDLTVRLTAKLRALRGPH